ncbi:hypothetical protein OFB84_32705, partial [Escherichia coli]|nr:hypothetical protein [Escherichia coli]
PKKKKKKERKKKKLKGRTPKVKDNGFQLAEGTVFTKKTLPQGPIYRKPTGLSGCGPCKWEGRPGVDSVAAGVLALKLVRWMQR